MQPDRESQPLSQQVENWLIFALFYIDTSVIFLKRRWLSQAGTY